MISRRNWTEEEEKMLAELQTGDFKNSWNLIAKELNERFMSKSRTGKQCRERFINYIQAKSGSKPTLKWEKSQIHHFYCLFREYGPKWTIISRIIGKKSENCLKNMFYGNLRKTTRMINKIDKDFGTKKTKPIKYESLLRIVSSSEKQCWSFELMQSYEKLKLRLLILMESINEEPTIEEVLEIIHSIHSFNSDLKSNFNQKKMASCQSEGIDAIDESCKELCERLKEPAPECTCSTQNLANDKSQQNEQDFSKVFENLKKMKSSSCLDHQNKAPAQQNSLCQMMICQDENLDRFYSSANIDLNYDLCKILHRPYSLDSFEFTF